MTKTLNEKAITIHGKKYVLVADRILFFNETYPNGSIITKLVSEPTSKQVVVKAKVTPDLKNPARYFTGYSQAIVGGTGVNATAALENAETSAVGRALAMMGIGIMDSVASADEVNKATAPRDIIREPVSGECTEDHDKLPILVVKKEGKNKGRKFQTCAKCGMFRWIPNDVH